MHLTYAFFYVLDGNMEGKTLPPPPKPNESSVLRRDPNHPCGSPPSYNKLGQRPSPYQTTSLESRSRTPSPTPDRRDFSPHEYYGKANLTDRSRSPSPGSSNRVPTTVVQMGGGIPVQKPTALNLSVRRTSHSSLPQVLPSPTIQHTYVSPGSINFPRLNPSPTHFSIPHDAPPRYPPPVAPPTAQQNLLKATSSNQIYIPDDYSIRRSHSQNTEQNKQPSKRHYSNADLQRLDGQSVEVTISRKVTKLPSAHRAESGGWNRGDVKLNSYPASSVSRHNSDPVEDNSDSDDEDWC